jgi:hypothetical protein
MSGNAESACRRSPVAFRLGATGVGVGVGCGLGVGWGSPVNFRGVPVVESAAAGLSSGVDQLRGLLPQVKLPLPAGLRAGMGCGVGVGYGFGAGLMLRPSLVQSLRAAVESLLHRAPLLLAGEQADSVASVTTFARRGEADGEAPPKGASPTARGHTVVVDEASGQVTRKLAELSAAVHALAEEQTALRVALCASLPDGVADGACRRRRAALGDADDRHNEL